MNPIFLHLGPVTIHWYGVFMALAFLTGFANWIVLGRRAGRDAQFCSDLLFWVMIAGLVGGRIAYIASEFRDYAADPRQIFAIWKGGLIFYGGFIGAILAVYIFARRHHIAFLALLDFAMTSLPLAHALGRIGCFMTGCCFGAPRQNWPGIAFPAFSPPWDRHIELGLITRQASCSLPVHPVQLYETLWNLALYPILLLVFRRRKADGVTTGTYLLLYPLGRFLLEGLRGTERIYVGPISTAQLVSLAMMALGAMLLLTRHKNPRTD